MLARVMAGESNRAAVITPGGREPPRFHDKELSKEVTTVFSSELEVYKLDRI